MGCDIHLVVEVRRDGKWRRALPPPEDRDPWYAKMAAEERARWIVQAGNAVRTHGAPDNWAEARSLVEWYHERHYTVFSELAGVRMRYGARPISPPRGFPADLSPEVLALMAADGSGEDVYLEPEGPRSDIHSSSWLTLRELRAHAWPKEALDSDFGHRFLPALVRLREREGVAEDDVRIVFGFDN